jgi:hypothetical protein
MNQLIKGSRKMSTICEIITQQEILNKVLAQLQSGNIKINVLAGKSLNAAPSKDLL